MLQTTMALLVFLVPLAYSPGPGNLFFAALGARFGLRASLSANLGYHAATWMVTLGLGLGFATLHKSAPVLVPFLRWAGVTYILWLALSFLMAGLSGGVRDIRAAGVVDGVLLLILNPKAYVIIALMFTQFLDAFAMSRSSAVLWISTVFTLNNFVAFTLWTMLGDTLLSHFRQPKYAAVLNGACAILLVAVAIWMSIVGSVEVATGLISK